MVYYLEDDKEILNLVLYSLNAHDIECKGFLNSTDFFNEINERIPNLILLDIMLPDIDGITILKKLKNNEKLKNIPVIIISAKDSEFDTILGLDLGADDYISKPFRIMELISRIRANLRRNFENTSNNLLFFKNISIDLEKRIVKVDDEKIDLTFKEYEVLCKFIKNPEIVFTRNQLLDDIWGYSYIGESRTVDVHIKTLRTKLKTAKDYIKTIRGVGYKLE